MDTADLLRETPDIETASDNYASRFSGSAGRYFLDVQEQAVHYVLRGRSFASVLDVGGGHGQLVPIFLKYPSGLTILGSDECTHKRVRESFPDAKIHFATGDVVHLPYPDRSFDIVIAVRLISHIEHWETMLAEFCRVARQSVVIDYPSWNSLNTFTPLLFNVKKSFEGNTRTYTSFFLGDLARVFKLHGFAIASTRKQLFLPMVLHRACHGARWLQRIENVLSHLGVTALFGSPVVIRADRQ
ncbi:MAG: class I SAM-dependent methyltransferase [Woeseiaceae bacterium]